MPQNPDAALIQSVYKPNDVATYALDIVATRAAERDKALKTQIATVDTYMRPVLPGEVVFVMAYTSHGKTAFMQYWARQVVNRLPDDNSIAVYVSWETLVEELGIYDLCGMTGLDASRVWYGDLEAGDMGRLKTAGMKRAAMPLWILGYSLKRRRKVRALSMEVVAAALAAVEKHDGRRPAIIFLDYIQKITPRSPRMDRRVAVLENVDHIQDLARDCGCPVIVGCQAGRQVLEREDKRPRIGDGQETSRIEQDADKVISLLYPCKFYQEGATMPGWDSLTVTPELMICTILKQRHAESGQSFPLRFDAARNTFTSWGGG